ncbi:MAG: hypothetical protein P8Y42_18930, partial [Exilibacterium sp.]
KKLSAAQKRARKKAKEERQRKYQWVFMNGKQVRIKRPPTIDGIAVDEWIANNADPIWLHQNEMWEYIKVDDEGFSEFTEKDELMSSYAEYSITVHSVLLNHVASKKC